jgi:hypothetical protein
MYDEFRMGIDRTKPALTRIATCDSNFQHDVGKPG